MTQPPRRALTPREKALVLARQNGRCDACGELLSGKVIEYDHTRARGLMGSEDVENRRAICLTPCHREKTKDDRRRIAKAKRQRRALPGVRKKRRVRAIKSRGFDKRWRKKMSGAVEPRVSA